MGLLMGAPILDNILSRLASALQTFVFQQDTGQHLSGTEDGSSVKTKGSPEEAHSVVRITLYCKGHLLLQKIHNYPCRTVQIFPVLQL